MTQAHAAMTRRLLLLSDPASLRPAADVYSLVATYPARARQEIARLLAQASARGLKDRIGAEHGLTSEEPAQRLAACQAVASCLPEGEACTPHAVDWLVFAHAEKQDPRHCDAGGQAPGLRCGDVGCASDPATLPTV